LVLPPAADGVLRRWKTSAFWNVIFCARCLTRRVSSRADDNGLNPVWESNNSSNSSFDFDVNCPEMAFLRFTVYDQDMFGDPSEIAMATIPVLCIKPGDCIRHALRCVSCTWSETAEIIGLQQAKSIVYGNVCKLNIVV